MKQAKKTIGGDMPKKDPEAEFKKVAAQRRAEHEQSPKAVLAKLVEFKTELERALDAAYQSVETVVKTADAEGNITTSVYHGIAGGTSSKDSVTRSNIRSRRERAEALKRAIQDVSATIDSMEKNGRLSDEFDLATYIKNWRGMIPDRNVMEAL